MLRLIFLSAILAGAVGVQAEDPAVTPKSEYALELRGITDFKRVQEVRALIESTLPEGSEVMERQFSRGDLIFAVSMRGEHDLLMAVVRDAVPVRDGGPTVSADGDDGVTIQWP